MPIYLYEHPETKEVKEIVQGMNEKHVYSEAGVEWKRIFIAPSASIDKEADPFSPQAFKQKTDNMKGLTIGQMWDMSGELSEKRAKRRDGVDPIKQATVKEYEKKTQKAHPLAKPAPTTIEI